MPVDSAGSLALPARVVIQHSIRGSSWFGERRIVSPLGRRRTTTPMGSPATSGARAEGRVSAVAFVPPAGGAGAGAAPEPGRAAEGGAKAARRGRAGVAAGGGE